MVNNLSKFLVVFFDYDAYFNLDELCKLLLKRYYELNSWKEELPYRKYVKIQISNCKVTKFYIVFLNAINLKYYLLNDIKKLIVNFKKEELDLDFVRIIIHLKFSKPKL